MVRSVSRIRIGFSEVGKPTISVYSKKPNTNSRAWEDVNNYVYPHVPTYNLRRLIHTPQLIL